MSTPSTDTPRARVLMEYLPAIYQAQPDLAIFLQPFESILLGGAARLPDEPFALREEILSASRYLDPDLTPEEFLPWLASWVALGLRVELAPERKRMLIGCAAALFQWRGTIRGLRELLQIVAGNNVVSSHELDPRSEPDVKITEPMLQSLSVGVEAVVGTSTRLGADRPHFFEVTIPLPGTVTTKAEYENFKTLVSQTIELGKPAHTYYQLKLTDSKGYPVRAFN